MIMVWVRYKGHKKGKFLGYMFGPEPPLNERLVPFVIWQNYMRGQPAFEQIGIEHRGHHIPREELPSMLQDPEEEATELHIHYHQGELDLAMVRNVVKEIIRGLPLEKSGRIEIEEEGFKFDEEPEIPTFDRFLETSFGEGELNE